MLEQAIAALEAAARRRRAMIRAAAQSVARCGLRFARATSRGTRAAAPRPPPAPRRSDARPRPQTTARPRIVVLGDSLTAGSGSSPTQAYPALLQQRLDARG